ncbi:MAG: cytochrome c biogenesis protein CcsA [Planctomycetaceae bacterium]|nr:cytochrome c biogenesis protein CcsA [Planctomycetaceae bacterium]
MPLSSFARQIVFEICGTTHPFFNQDNTALAELDRIIENERLLESNSVTLDNSPDNIPNPPIPSDIKSIDTGLGIASEVLRHAKHNITTNRIERIPYMTSEQARNITDRIRTLIPPQGRYFEPSELLLSWMLEPEIWEFIPLIYVPESDYRQLQGFPLVNNTGATLMRVSIFQLKNSDNFKLRHFELSKKQQNPTNPELSDTDKITERILSALFNYENLTFDPKRHTPAKMIDILQTAIPKSFNTAQQVWNELHNIGIKNENLTPTNEPQNQTHTTSKRWNEIYVELNQLAENFITNSESEQQKIPNINTVELRYEKILNLIKLNIDESNAFMQKIYKTPIAKPNTSNNNSTNSTTSTQNAIAENTAENTAIDPDFILPQLFSPQNLADNEAQIRQWILTYNYALKSLYREVEAAYIAFYDNGRTLRVMPIISAQTLNDADTEFTVNPWASMRLILNGGENAIRRFIDPNFMRTKSHITTTPTTQNVTTNVTTTQNTTDISNESHTQDTISMIDQLSITHRLSNDETKNNNLTNKNDNSKNSTDPNSTDPNTANKDNINTNNRNNNVQDNNDTKSNSNDNSPEENIDIFENADTNIYARPDFTSDDIATASFVEPVLKLRINFLEILYTTFISPTRIDAQSQMRQACLTVQQLIRECALRAEVQRHKLADSDEQLSKEILNKTHYPLYGEIGMEHFYFSISPFFWMMILAIGSIIFGIVAIIAAFLWREITATINTPVVKKISEEEAAIETGKVSVSEMSGIKSGIKSGVKPSMKSGVKPSIKSEIKLPEIKSDKTTDETIDLNYVMESIVAPEFYSSGKLDYSDDSLISEMQSQSQSQLSQLRMQTEKMAVGGTSAWQEVKADYTNSIEEVMLWLGVGFLLVSIIVALIGGVMRALISGWAPVTNMYETVILMAVSAAVIGIWYTLYPLVQPACALAWRYTEFPTLSQFSKFFRTNRNENADITNVTASEAVIREAVQHLGGNYVGGNIKSDVGDLLSDGASWVMSKVESEKSLAVLRQVLLAVPRIILMLITFFILMRISYSDASGATGWVENFSQSIVMLDVIDLVVVLVSIGAIVWFVPRIILSMLIFLPLLLFKSGSVAMSVGVFSNSDMPAVSNILQGNSMSSVFSGESVSVSGVMLDNSGSIWFKAVRNKILDRKLFLIAAAVIVFLAGFFAYGNTAQLNPNFKPLTAVLRSNFWLTVHVIAIIVSYAAAFIAWSMSVIALGAVIFGRYEIEFVRGRKELKFPLMFDMFVPTVMRLIKFSLLLLAVGTILGARWADYSWGRFWGWDPKEVWALITILFFAIVLHARVARYYSKIGIIVGALFSSIAVIMTWYGINFVFKGSVHSYGAGAANAATLFLIVFITTNLLWGVAAIVRYKSELNR